MSNCPFDYYYVFARCGEGKQVSAAYLSSLRTNVSWAQCPAQHLCAFGFQFKLASVGFYGYSSHPPVSKIGPKRPNI